MYHSESRRSSLVEIQEESEEESSNTENSKDSNGSMGFELNTINNVPVFKDYDDNESQDPHSYPKQSDETDITTTSSSQEKEGEKQQFSKPKSILKKYRRGSTP